MALVDIVVLVHDRADWADLCIRSVERFTRNDYRLIIVDSASKEAKTHEWLKEVKGRGHTVVHLGENRSFSSGVNAGVMAGDSKFIIVLNDDAIVTEGWDSALLHDAAEKMTGLVGARSNFAGGVQGGAQCFGKIPFLVFVCVCLRRQVWDTVGPMDEVTFDGFSSEDLDYSWRVKKAGYDLKLSSAFVLHAGSRTLISTVGAETAARQKNNEKYGARLVEKWGKEFAVENSRLEQRGLVVSYHSDVWTRVEFMKNLINLRNSGGVGFSYLQICRHHIAFARNKAADFAIENGYDWLVQLDDDATFPPTLLRQLLTHGKDVVCALAYQRGPPFLPCIFELGEDKMFGGPMLGMEHTGLRKVDVSGFHCSIIKTSVFKRLREGLKDANGELVKDAKTGLPVAPPTRNYYGGFDNAVGEDFAFCLQLKKHGIQVYCDTELIAGHIGDAIVVDEAYRNSWLAMNPQHR